MINHNYLTSVSACVVGGHPSVAECAVIARDDDLKGQVPMGLVVLKTGADIDEETLSKELTQMIRSAIGAIACYKETHI